ncbi:TRAP transporter small permease [Chelativorans alearense]|uniref:TRAP transporter small permease n=1 Tax=Chelativorans alearense TaxID=2681495 RepID=UPI0013CFABA7|nr:TRAP transporter small permease [Chelativorans alearense]
MRAIWTFLEKNTERYLVAGILGVLVIVLATQVVMRYALRSPVVWSEELARYLLIWCTFIGVSLAVREARNISVDLLPVLFGARSQRFFTILAHLGAIAFFALTTYYSLSLVMRIRMIGQASPGLGIQMWLIYAAVPVGLGLASLRTLQALWLMRPAGRSEAE